MPRWPWWAALTLAIASCDSGVLAPGRGTLISAMTKGCEKEAKGMNCQCLVKEVTADFTDAELRLVASDESFFTQDEWAVLMRRRALACFRPQWLAACKDNGCRCVINGLVDTYEGDALWDVFERFNQGRAVPGDVSALIQRCRSSP